ncbi:hypothetical protein BS17DRAFT_425371 [Gyrodon lividus]|nr:hypothetical protein BS17DRAFT_425371 [Gyrodon lividus]
MFSSESKSSPTGWFFGHASVSCSVLEGRVRLPHLDNELETHEIGPYAQTTTDLSCSSVLWRWKGMRCGGSSVSRRV